MNVEKFENQKISTFSSDSKVWKRQRETIALNKTRPFLASHKSHHNPPELQLVSAKSGACKWTTDALN